MIAEVQDASQIGQARRLGLELARREHFDETDSGRVAIIVTEMATNLVKHAGGGHIAVDRFDDADGVGIEIVSLDKGPGMADFQSCARDGFSTAGSPGTGLGAIARQSSRIAVFSRLGQGTVLMARCRAKQVTTPRTRSELGAIMVPYPGEQECGDAWALDVSESGDTLLVADGSGHGPLAASAAERAVAMFQANARQDCTRVVANLHRALAATRGAAVAVARVDRPAGVVRFVGVGNIAGTLITEGQIRRMVSHGGTAGHVAPRIHEFTYPFRGRPMLILHSDGVGTRWDLAAYPGLAQLHPTIIAGVIYRDHCRGRDDATVVVLRGAA